ncbi:MAG: ABC transporter permease [Deferribacterales bacterium]
MKSSKSVLNIFLTGYMILFFLYLFTPLMFMTAAAFNSSSFPTFVPWQGATLSWFETLFKDKILWGSVLNSVIIGVGVIILAVPTGLAGAMLLTSRGIRGRGFLYALMVSPILTPGVILGISTLIFWDNMGVPGGIFLTVIGQTAYISSFCMLMFMARLQRFDRTLEEAAMDLGATHKQVFRRITLPFLRPAIYSAVLIAFLQSFENYNTTLFVIGAETTMTIRIASMVRLGITPEINALAVLFILFTVLAAVLYEIRRRNENRRAEAAKEAEEREEESVQNLQLDMQTD